MTGLAIAPIHIAFASALCLCVAGSASAHGRGAPESSAALPAFGQVLRSTAFTIRAPAPDVPPALAQTTVAPFRDPTVPDAPGGALPSSAIRNVDGLSRSEARSMKERCRPVLAASETYEDNLVELCRLLESR